MRYIIAIGVITGLIGCGGVDDRGLDAVGGRAPDAGSDTIVVGTGGAGGQKMTDAGVDTGTDSGCVENTRADCRDRGTALVSAQYVCRDDGYNSTEWSACGTDGFLTGYYAGLPCPFDVGIVNSAGWTGPAPECTDNVIITNGGGSTAAVWTNTNDTIYCCNGNTVQKIARCR